MKLAERGGDWGLLALLALCVVSGAAVLWREGGAAFGAILLDDALLALAIAPKLVGAVLLVAWLRILIPRDRVVAWFGRAQGWRGLVRAVGGGALVPGGPAAAYSISAALGRMGADAGAAIAFTTGWLLLGLSRALIWELAFLDPLLVAQRLALSLPAAALLGLIAQRVFRAEGAR